MDNEPLGFWLFIAWVLAIAAGIALLDSLPAELVMFIAVTAFFAWLGERLKQTN